MFHRTPEEVWEVYLQQDRSMTKTEAAVMDERAFFSWLTGVKETMGRDFEIIMDKALSLNGRWSPLAWYVLWAVDVAIDLRMQFVAGGYELEVTGDDSTKVFHDPDTYWRLFDDWIMWDVGGQCYTFNVNKYNNDRPFSNEYPWRESIPSGSRCNIDAAEKARLSYQEAFEGAASKMNDDDDLPF
jgi:hypothetical protein